MWGVVVLFECCDALLAAFQYASAFNSDLSKWQTGKVTNMEESKCTLSRCGVLVQAETRICELTHLVVFVVEIVVFFVCGGCCHSLRMS